ncbi:MAG TPA: UDP-4-amino-4,6-dideoxy-N-acetyl-beta-L-altrosamine N-acetyltransferase [Caulobacter sp.]|nr:UDP-4-amino-4,6-dideoxy-N-acetyl-beta-L-altrosamine N-acetyltransferase [Caulobacter sp.]
MTERPGRTVTLRALTEGDRRRLRDWRNSPEVAAYMYSDHLIGVAEHDRWFDGLAGDPRRRDWVIEADGEPVGLTSLTDIDQDQGRGTIARYLGVPAVRGRGVGAAAEFKVIDHAFTRLGLRKIWSEVLESNAVAWGLHLANGFQREALLRAHVVKGGAPRDVVGLGLLAEDWRAHRPQVRERLILKGYDGAALDAPLPD